MIAAASPRDSSLGLVQLIFSLVANPTQPVPDELKAHLTKIIAEAKELLADPKQISNRTNPEAIALALEMMRDDVLTASVDEITTFDSINSVLARKVLERMETRPAY
jgi:hypothetical protein